MFQFFPFKKKLIKGLLKQKQLVKNFTLYIFFLNCGYGGAKEVGVIGDWGGISGIQEHITTNKLKFKKISGQTINFNILLPLLMKTLLQWQRKLAVTIDNDVK